MRGFTLVETLVVLGIVAAMMTVAVQPFRAMDGTRDATDAGRAYVYALREAALKAQTMEQDSAWGVRLATSSITVFSGASYASRTASRDRVFGIASDLAFSGPTEVVFAKFSGAPGTTGTTTISNRYASSTVNVNAAGTVAC